MEVKEGQRFYCAVCGSEITVTKGGNQVAPYMCCGVEMIEVK